MADLPVLQSAKLVNIIQADDSQGVKDMLEAVERLYKRVIKPDLDAIITGIKYDVEVLQEDVTKLEMKVDSSVEALALKLVDLEVHERKRSLIISGLEGDRGENEALTRSKVFDLNYELFSTDYTPLLTACHRLTNMPNAKIIAVFCNLDDKEYWIKNAKFLKDYNAAHESRVSVSPSLPPAIKCLQEDLLKKRRELSPDEKRHCVIKYTPSWPYCFLKFSGVEKNPIYPNFTKAEIVKNIIN